MFSAAINTSVQLFVLLGMVLSCGEIYKAIFLCLSNNGCQLIICNSVQIICACACALFQKSSLSCEMADVIPVCLLFIKPVR